MGICKAGNGNGIGNWKRNWKLEIVVKCLLNVLAKHAKALK